MTDRSGPNAPPWWWLASAGVAGAFFSLLWAVEGSAFLQKDWSIASRVRFLGAGNVIKPTGFSSGPLSAVYFSVTHSLVGQHPATHVVLLAALNGVVAVLVLVLGARLFGRWTGFWAAAVWVALPNRASTRLWVSTAPAVLSLALVLLGILLLHQGRRRAAWVVLAAAVLAHWATVGVALAAVGVHVWRARRAGVPAWRLAVPAALVLAALAVTITWSSRGHGAASVGSSTREAVAAQFGSGTFGPLAWGGGLLVMAAVLVALGRAFVPDFPGPPFSGVDRAVLTGAGLVAAGVVPFLVAGYPTGVGGLVDQANLVAGLGTVLILGALLAWVVPQAGGAGLVAAAVAVGYVAAFNTADLRDYRRAVDDGDALLSQLHADLPDIPSSLVVGPPLPDRNGVAQFAGDDLGAAPQLRRGEPGLRARIAVSTKDFESAGDRLRYDWTLHTIVVPRR